MPHQRGPPLFGHMTTGAGSTTGAPNLVLGIVVMEEDTSGTVMVAWPPGIGGKTFALRADEAKAATERYVTRDEWLTDADRRCLLANCSSFYRAPTDDSSISLREQVNQAAQRLQEYVETALQRANEQMGGQ